MLNLSIAIERYDHVRDLLDGSVRADGIEFTVLNLPVEETFFRFIKYQEFDTWHSQIVLDNCYEPPKRPA